MKSVYLMAFVAALLITSDEGWAESADEILDAAWSAQEERWKGLDSYLVQQSVMGRSSKQYYVRTTAVDAAGKSRTMFLLAVDAGLEPGCVNPYTATDATAGRGDSSAQHLSWFMENAELVGEEAVDGKAAWKLRASEVDRSQVLDQGEMSVSAMTIWIGKDGYLPLRMRMDGTAEIQGQARSVTMDMVASDFRAVPGSQLVEPFRRTVSMSGMMSGMDESQVAEAKRAMAEFEKQLAEMPESQREMMKSMMGPRIEQMRKMAESGSLDSEIVIESITPNPEAFGERIVACN